MSDKLTAIIVCRVNTPGDQVFLKYRNIKDTEAHRRRFLQFASGKPGARYVNWYNKRTKQFLTREYINQTTI